MSAVRIINGKLNITYPLDHLQSMATLWLMRGEIMQSLRDIEATRMPDRLAGLMARLEAMEG